MKSKNTICLWFNKDAHEAARFYATTFPNSEVTAVREAPSDYPGSGFVIATNGDNGFEVIKQIVLGNRMRRFLNVRV